MSERAISNAKHFGCDKPSEVGIRVLNLLDQWHGLHHFDSSLMKKANWADQIAVEVKLDTHTSVGQLSTFDFNALTRLVFLAHDHCIRVDIRLGGPRHFKLIFHPRNVRKGGMSQRHPTIEKAVASWRESNRNIDIADEVQASA